MLCVRYSQKLWYPIALAFTFCTAFSVPAIAQLAPLSDTKPNVETVRVNYILGSGDQLDITVFDYSEYTGAKVILPDGTITMPLIGRIPASGKTTEQLAREINDRLASLLINPVVTVNLTVLRPVVVNVSGEVQRPGAVQLRSLTTTGLTIGGNTVEGVPTLSAAIVEAGGITQNADIRQVILQRHSADRTYLPITVNLWDAISSANAAPDLILQDGDSIYVPRLTSESDIDRRLVARSRFAPATVRVRVVGEVNSPGEVQVPPNSSLSSAVAIAGGPTEDARLSKVAFIRLNSEGMVERETIDLRNLSDDYQIQEGDVIVVPKKNSSSILDFAGQLVSPLGVLLNLFQ